MTPRPTPQSDRDLVAVHSSDLHIDDVANRPGASDGLDMLTAVLAAGHRHQADVILLAGDTFESPPLTTNETIHYHCSVHSFMHGTIVVK